MSIKIQPYFAEGEKFPALIGVRAEGDEHETAYVSKSELVDALAENDRLRELVRGLHMAYVETLNECESLDEGLIWECSGNIDADVAKSRAKFKADRHRFDAALRELGIEVNE